MKIVIDVGSLLKTVLRSNNKVFRINQLSSMAGPGQDQLSNQQLIASVASVVPPLASTAHKGQAGRVGIVGGSLEYTGAPYFAAIAALRCGADLAHVFCSREAAGPIKAYSPELIVHPVLDGPDPMTEIEEWLPRLHALLLGPGLGRRPQTFATLQHIIQAAMEKKILLVFDADALFYLNENFDVLQGYKSVILTPNRVEFARLYRGVLKEELRADHVTAKHIEHLSTTMGVTILCKGQTDIIAGDGVVLTCDVTGSPRRCGGQGDVLAGATALFYYWAFGTANACPNTPILMPPAVLAAWGAAALTRASMNIAFRAHGRGTLTTDMLQTVSQAFAKLYEQGK